MDDRRLDWVVIPIAMFGSVVTCAAVAYVVTYSLLETIEDRLRRLPSHDQGY